MLQAQIIEYLESKGWYFDWDLVNEDLTWYEDMPRGQVMRQAHAWTLPQWGEYSQQPSEHSTGSPAYN